MPPLAQLAHTDKLACQGTLLCMQLWHSLGFLVLPQVLQDISVRPAGQPLTLVTAGLGVMPAIQPSAAATPVPQEGGDLTSATCFREQVPAGHVPSALQPAAKRPNPAAGMRPRMLLVAEMGDRESVYAVQEPALPQPSCTGGKGGAENRVGAVGQQAGQQLLSASQASEPP